MKTKALLSFFVFLFATKAFSQKIAYAGSFETTLVNGSYETELAVSTAHGIRFGNWSTAVGAGIDYYRFRSVPLFIDVKRYVPLRKFQPFIQAGAGVNIAWPTDGQKIFQKWWSSWWPQTDTLPFRNGFHGKLLLGVVFNPQSRVKIGISAGWNYKTQSTVMQEMVHNGAAWVYEPRITIYRMSRLSAGLNVGF